MSGMLGLNRGDPSAKRKMAGENACKSLTLNGKSSISPSEARKMGVRAISGFYEPFQEKENDPATLVGRKKALRKLRAHLGLVPSIDPSTLHSAQQRTELCPSRRGRLGQKCRFLAAADSLHPTFRDTPSIQLARTPRDVASGADISG